MSVRFALVNALSFASFTAAFWGWGSLVAGRTVRLAWRPAVGLGAAAIAAALGYRFGLPLALLGRILFGVGAIGLMLGLIRARQTPPSVSLAQGAIAAAVVLLLWLPASLGGAQFALFQANSYDQFNYLSTAASHVPHSFAQLASSTPADVLRDPLIPNARFRLDARPAVVDLYASFEGIAPGRLFEAHYGFLCALLLVSFSSLAAVVGVAVGATGGRTWLIAAAFVLGYWGQLEIDLNAWSWAAATGVLVASLGLLLELLESPSGTARGAGCAAALGVGLAGLAYLYPEMTVFFGPGVIVTAGTALWRSPGSRRSVLTGIGVAAAVALVLILPAIRSTLGFAGTQAGGIASLNHSPLDWMWQALVGPAPSSSLNPGWWAQWLTAVGGLEWLPGAAGRWAGMAVILAAGVALARPASLPHRPPALSALKAIGGISVALILVLVAIGQWWLAAKATTYAAAIALPLLLVPATARPLSGWGLPAVLLLGLHLAMGLLRVPEARRVDGIHYLGYPYPAVLDPVLKRTRAWDLPDVHEALAGSHGLKIDAPELWLEDYAMIIADATDTPFFKTTPVTDLWHFSNRDLGLQPVIPGYDALAYLEYQHATQHAQLAFARTDGRVFSARVGARLTRIESPGALDTLGGMLAWTVGQKPGANASRLSFACDRPGTYRLHLSVATGEDATHTRALALVRDGAVIEQIPIRVSGQAASQPVVATLELAAGPASVIVIAQAAGTDQPAPVALTLFDPYLEPIP